MLGVVVMDEHSHPQGKHQLTDDRGSDPRLKGFLMIHPAATTANPS